MSRYFVRFLILVFFKAVACGFCYGYEDERRDASQSDAAATNDGESSNGDDDITKDVHSIVDKFLKINNHVEPSIKDPKIKKLMKEQNIGKQIDRLRSDLVALQETLSEHYKIASKSAKDDEKSDESKKSETKRQRRRYRKKQLRDKLYTVKKIYTSSGDHWGKRSHGSFGNYKARHYDKNHASTEWPQTIYKIKSYGTNSIGGTSGNFSTSNSKLTVKPKEGGCSVFGSCGSNPCSQVDGKEQA
jgi:Mg2+ and Co2+ transporter CorA